MAQEPLNDPDLICRAQAGDQDAINALAERCATYSYTITWLHTNDPHLSEDIAQETCIKFLRSLQTIELSGAKGWVTRVACNALRDEKRKKRPTSWDMSAGSEAGYEPQAREPDPCQPDDERVVLLMQRLDRLPRLQRDVLLFQKCFGLSASETAECLGISVEQVNRATHQASKYLRTVLQRDWPELFGQPDK